MATLQLCVAFDESGTYGGPTGAEVWAMAAVVASSASIPEKKLIRAWHTAWARAGSPTAPSIQQFHATRFNDRAQLARVGQAAANLTEAGFGVAAVGGRANPQARSVDYIEGALAVIEHATGGLGLGPGDVVQAHVWTARRDALDLKLCERLATDRILSALRARGAQPASVHVLWHVSTPSHESALAWSDLLSYLALRHLRDHEPAPFPVRVLDAEDEEWRRPADATPQMRAHPASVSSAPKAAARPRTLPSFDVAVAVVCEGDLAWEQRRDLLAAERALTTARRALQAGFEPLQQDELSLRIDSLETALANHAGTLPHTVEPEAAAIRTARLLGADRATDAALLFENRRIIARTNAFDFSGALEGGRPIVPWLRTMATMPFGPGANSTGSRLQLSQYLGTLGQLHALAGYSTRDTHALDQAVACFREARAGFNDPGDVQRQHTYQLHALAERLRIGDGEWSPARALEEAEALDGPGTRGALQRVVAAGSSAELGDVFRLHAWVKLAVLAGAPSGLPDSFHAVLASAPEVHPWPILAAWARNELVAAGRSSASVPGAIEVVTRLAKRAAAADLVGFAVKLLLLDGVPKESRPGPETLAKAVPAFIRPGWANGGYADRLARMGELQRPSGLLPFNFC